MHLALFVQVFLKMNNFDFTDVQTKASFLFILPIYTSLRFFHFTGSLYFANLEQGDATEAGYQYKLDVSNTVLDATVGGSPYTLTVSSNPGMCNSVFILSESK